MDAGAYLWIAALAASMVVLHLLVVAYLYRTVGGEVRPDGDEPAGGPSWSLFGASTDRSESTVPADGEESSGMNGPGHARPDAEDTAGDPPRDAGADADAHVEADELTPCPTCGTPNDPTYRFCRWCIADLSDTGTSIGGAGGTERLRS